MRAPVSSDIFKSMVTLRLRMNNGLNVGSTVLGGKEISTLEISRIGTKDDPNSLDVETDWCEFINAVISLPHTSKAFV